MKIDVFFKNYHLGTLTFKDNHYIYNSNVTQEEDFKKNNVSAMFYGLFNSHDLPLNELPAFLQQYLDLQKNEFVSNQAKLNQNDTDFEKLYKLSLLKYDDISFYIGQKEGK